MDSFKERPKEMRIRPGLLAILTIGDEKYHGGGPVMRK
jgi:hypothetical protein